MVLVVIAHQAATSANSTLAKEPFTHNLATLLICRLGASCLATRREGNCAGRSRGSMLGLAQYLNEVHAQHSTNPVHAVSEVLLLTCNPWWCR
jgi:hypothetical protein